LRIGNVADDEPVRDLILDRPAFDAWAVQYRARLRAEDSDDDARRLAMNAVNPKYVLRNYLAQDAIDRALKKDFSEVARLQQILQHPFDEAARIRALRRTAAGVGPPSRGELLFLRPF
jgi:uncharacterized protein YdiU (UPF0061 family)